MREKSMTQLFLAENDYHAVLTAWAWAKGRYEVIIKDTYPRSSIGSIRVGEFLIGGLMEDNRMETKHLGPFFEWKCDFPMYSLEQYIAVKKEELNKPRRII
jgi:hypothetical protein